jgi:hypothetical protein
MSLLGMWIGAGLADRVIDSHPTMKAP